MTNRIAVHIENLEGALHIDGLTGQIVTPMGERPEWADGYAVALLAERTGWYEKRLGTHLPDSIRKPELIDSRDLGWVAFDAEGEEVEVEADSDYRMDRLAEHLNIDRMDFDGQKELDGVSYQADINQSYVNNPTEEETLEEAEGLGFSEVHKAHG